MLRLAFLLGVVSLLPECGRDETLTGYGASDTTWALTELHGAPFGASATLRFPEEGRIEGQAPCNTFTGQQSQPYPWFRAEQVASTRR
ncbi:MAG: META domain-containing protein, partial [Pseudomonadota bacterium]